MLKNIRTAGIVILALILVYAGAAAQQVDQVAGSTAPSATFAPGELLVRFQPSVAARRVDQILTERDVARSRRIRALDVDVLQLPPGLSVERAVEVFSHLPEVEFAEPNYILHVLAPPQEIVDQWGLLRIQAPEAWSLIETRNPVLIAITDTGIDRTHSDLAPNIWQNPGEIPGDGIDNDANGYVDDTWGWDFANNDNAIRRQQSWHDCLVRSRRSGWIGRRRGMSMVQVAAVVLTGAAAALTPWRMVSCTRRTSARGSSIQPGRIRRRVNWRTPSTTRGTRVCGPSQRRATKVGRLSSAGITQWRRIDQCR
jgi:subtilisin family serine protease